MSYHAYVLVHISPRSNTLTFARLGSRGQICWSDTFEVATPKSRWLGADDLGSSYLDVF